MDVRDTARLRSGLPATCGQRHVQLYTTSMDLSKSRFVGLVFSLDMPGNQRNENAQPVEVECEVSSGLTSPYLTSFRKVETFLQLDVAVTAMIS